MTDLLAQRSVAEKVGQLEQMEGQKRLEEMSSATALGETLEAVTSSGRVGSFLFVTDPVLAYTHHRGDVLSRLVRKLKAFTKVHLAAGETKTIALEIAADSLTYWSAALRRDVLESGTFDLWVGDNAQGGEHAVFELQN